jgi:hypothetical protein
MKIWNVSANPITFDMQRRAILPCDYAVVDATLGAELLRCPDWSLENPRKRPERATVKDVK